MTGVLPRDASVAEADGGKWLMQSTWLFTNIDLVQDLALGTPEGNEENEEANETRSLSPDEVLEPAFRQNPLVDNDYVFGQALGRYCKSIYPQSLTTYINTILQGTWAPLHHGPSVEES